MLFWAWETPLRKTVWRVGTYEVLSNALLTACQTPESYRVGWVFFCCVLNQLVVFIKLPIKTAQRGNAAPQSSPGHIIPKSY
jgi:hypothetical protein